MKKIFLFLLKQYSKSEKERLEIHSVLNEQVQETYREQTIYGNVYNANIEFIMGNDFIKKLVKENDQQGLSMIKNGLNESVTKGIEFIKAEKV